MVAEILLAADGNEELLRTKLRTCGADDPEAIIADAHEIGILISRDELEEARRFYGAWSWGPVARALMFGYHTASFADLNTELSVRREHEAADISLLPPAERDVIPLPDQADDTLTTLLKRRRSRRAFEQDPVALAPLAACLHAGFGLTGEVTSDRGRSLPLTAAPSPGGLNTYDALVIARAVSDLDPGTYGYLPQRHGLVRRTGAPVEFDRLFGEQAWAARAPCAIVFVASLQRQASKYFFPTTVPATLIEAGARAELVLLQAEESGLSGVIVGMVGVGAFDRQLAIDAGIWGQTSMTVPVCAVLLGASQT